MAMPDTHTDGPQQPTGTGTPTARARSMTRWPLVRQLVGSDRTGRGDAAKSAATAALTARTASADTVVKSICPFCAVGCGQHVYVTDGKVVQIEGDPILRSAAAGCVRKVRRPSS